MSTADHASGPSRPTSAAILLWIWLAFVAASFGFAVLFLPSWEWDADHFKATGAGLTLLLVGSVALWRWRHKFGPVQWRPFLLSLVPTIAVLTLLEWVFFRSWPLALLQAVVISWPFAAIPYVCNRQSAPAPSGRRE